MIRTTRTSFPLLLLLLALVAAEVSVAGQELSRRERRERLEQLTPRYQQFLEDVAPIITPVERDAFLRLETDDQREVFIEEFWRRRILEYGDEGYRDAYYSRLEIVDQRFRHKDTDRGRIFMIRGEPSQIAEITACRYIYDVEIWVYAQGGADDVLLFYNPYADFRLWDPGFDKTLAMSQLLNPAGANEGVAKVFYPWQDGRAMRSPLITRCPNHQLLLAAIEEAALKGSSIYDELQPPPVDEESIDRLLRQTVIADPDATTFESRGDVTYGGARGTRTITNVTVTLPRSDVTPLVLDEREFYRVSIVGEVTKAGRMFERFEYRYDLPDVETEELALTLERYLRAGDYRLRLKIIDEGSGSESFVNLELDVPPPDETIRAAGDSELAEASSAVIRIAERRAETILTGFVTFETIVTEDVASVEFFVDGESSGRKTRAPFDLNLDLGAVPRRHVVQANAFDADGELIGSDRITINDGVDPFRIRILSPRMTKGVSGRTRIEMQTRIPEGSELDGVDVYVDDVPVARLYGPPWVAWADLGPESRLRIIRAVATLSDAKTKPVEDVSVVNAPGTMETLDVRLIEMPVTVFADGRPLHDLRREDFSIADSRGDLEIVRFERQEDLPLSIGIAVDTSASMEERMGSVREAASRFLTNVLEPGDQAFLLAFGRLVWKPTGWTSNDDTLRYALASLRAESTTALYDGIIESLYQFEGTTGRKAIILLSDGADNASKFDWDATLSYARRMSIPVYVLGMSIPPTQLPAKAKLRTIAEETGGQAWFFDDLTLLEEIYAQIERELRTQYLVSFYARDVATTEWQPITVSSSRGEVRAPSGYYP